MHNQIKRHINQPKRRLTYIKLCSWKKWDRHVHRNFKGETLNMDYGTTHYINNVYDCTWSQLSSPILQMPSPNNHMFFFFFIFINNQQKKVKFIFQLQLHLDSWLTRWGWMVSRDTLSESSWLSSRNSFAFSIFFFFVSSTFQFQAHFTHKLFVEKHITK